MDAAYAAAVPQANKTCLLCQVLRKHRDTINTMLEPCVHDPMTEWHTPTHAARSNDAEAVARDALRIVAGERQSNNGCRLGSLWQPGLSLWWPQSAGRRHDKAPGRSS